MVKSRVIIASSLITAIMTVTPLFARQQPDGQEHLQRIDIDGDNQISEQEWNAYQTERFNELDANGNGLVSEREIKKHIRSMDDARSEDDEDIDREGPPGHHNSGEREDRE